MKNNFSKILIIVILIIVVAVVIILKNQPEETEKETKLSSGEETVEVLPQTRTDSILSGKKKDSKPVTETKEQTRTSKDETQTKKQESPAETENTAQSQTNQAQGNVLALVNGEEITKSYFEENYNNLSSQHKDMFKNNKYGYLDQLIIKELLVQKAIEKEYLKQKSSDQTTVDSGIQKLLEEVTQNIEIPEQEMRKFYEENKSQMQGAPFNEVKNNIHNYLAQQKQGEFIQAYIEELKDSADIILNEKWIEEQIAARPENPLTKVLNNGLPTVLDLGSDSCVPCKMMKPIFAELEEELEGKANILLLEIADYRGIANEYNVRVIPTQIFFDQNGEQYWRHEGFLSKEDILKKLKETGAEL
ncbi:MAG: hypothetical protein KGY75_09905 [Candidatus Cloacimonetes bacterium]|nr:hypothetical protein [Candidatus Cloacimonadota bacterium]MBS3768415.1 hypothetical protein [Candidatus Cloacimonadota bacterium]